MASSGNRDGSQARHPMALPEHESILGAGISARNLEAFSRKVTTTAGELIRPLSGEIGSGTRYVAAMGEVRKGFRRPDLQRRMFSMTQASPMEMMRSKLSASSEMQYRALTYLPDELLEKIPADNHKTYSLFQAFQATISKDASSRTKAHRRHQSRGRKLLAENGTSGRQGPPSMVDLKVDKDGLTHRLQMLAVRKSVSSSEIREIDGKIGNLNRRRKVVLDRLSELEQEEASIERDLLDVDNRIETMQEELDERALNPPTEAQEASETSPEAQVTDGSFMSESIYEKLPSPKARRHRTVRRKSMPILHEHIEPGTILSEIQAHHDIVTALDFDAPFGTMVTAALDDTVRVWDLQAGRCIGMLEGHHASVRCLQVEDNIVATGSTDASIRLWDLARAEYHPRQGRAGSDGGIGNVDDDAEDPYDDRSSSSLPPTTSGMQECALISLEAHVDEVTALHFQGEVLVSGSADKTLRQWDLVKGRCVQTLDVLWAAAQASTTLQTPPSQPDGDGHYRWRQVGRLPDASADFVGALQCFDAALACGTADGMVRLWDLRSGQVHRSLIGHTGPVTCLQFDDVHLVTGSLDRSIRIWDLRTGSIFDAYAYDHPITSMQFDHRRIVAAAGEAVIKVYDKVDGRHWDCGGGGGGGSSDGLELDPLPLDRVFTPTSSVSPSASVSSSRQTLGAGGAGAGAGGAASIVEQVRIKDGYLIEGRKDGVVGIWSC